MITPFWTEWKRFLETDDPSRCNVPPAILHSWLRCRKQGFPDVERALPVLVPKGELERRLHEYHRVFDAAQPYLEELAKMVRGTGCLVVLTDPNGVILHTEGDPEAQRRAEGFGLVVGADWSEPSTGTNAMGLAAVTQESVEVIGAQHFLPSLHPLACAAAPIRSPLGDLLGIIDVTGPWSRAPSHLGSMVQMAAKAVQAELRNHIAGWASVHSILRDIWDRTGQACLLLDSRGNIRWASQQAARVFAVGPDRLLGLPLQHFLADPQDSPNVLSKNQQGTVQTLFVRTATGRVRCAFRCYPIAGDPDTHGYLVFMEAVDEPRKTIASPQPLPLHRARYTFDDFIGNSPAVLALKAEARRAAATDLTVLILGETGTGKEILAHAIHAASPRANGPFIAVNCAAIPDTLLESELFGYEAGAFTGASPKGKPGKFEQANGGTLFLDEIGDMPLAMQAALLRVLQDGYVVRIGGSRPIPVNVRIIAATNKDLHAAAAAGTFRSDLLYRLDVITLRIPPLRQRREDIPVLAEFFVRKLRNDPTLRLTPAVLESFQQYDWPGNVRELENTVAKCVYASPGPAIDVDALPAQFAVYVNGRPRTPTPEPASAPPQPTPDHPSGAPLSGSIAELERNAIATACQRAGGNLSKAARMLGISRPTLYRKIKQYGIAVPPRSRKQSAAEERLLRH